VDPTTAGTGDVRIVKKDPVIKINKTNSRPATDLYCTCGNLLGPVRPQHGGKLKIIDRVLATLQNRDDLKGVSVVLVEEALWALKICGDGLRVRVLLSGENEEFEAVIRGRQILYVHLTCIGCAH
jgi:hypothetical protein